MSASIKISGAVGHAAINHAKDVVIVQRLLNGHMKRDPRRKLLIEDGKWSLQLEEAINTFQKLADAPVTVSGRIDPGSRLLEILSQSPVTFGFERRIALLEQKARNGDGSTIEVFVYDAILTSAGSQWGHAAIDIDGTTYSRAHSSYVALERSKYLASNLRIRDVVGLSLRVSPAEKAKIKSELDRRVVEQKPYSIIDNSCSTNVAEVLEMVGILAHDPRFQLNPFSTRLVSPKELLITVSRSSRLVKRNDYNKGAG